MSDESDRLQRAAETRVHRRFDRETAELQKWQDDVTQRDSLSQSRYLDESHARQSTLETRKAIELAGHDTLWNQAKGRLTPRPAQTLTFDMMGGPPEPRPNARGRGGSRRDRGAAR